MLDRRRLRGLLLGLALAAGACPAQAFGEGRLLFAADLIRHGDRTPLAELPADPRAWEQGFGQLTGAGMRQEFELGARLRGEYVERYRLLPSSYAVGTIYARSTDFDRTLMSAQCLLLGLYPPGTGPFVFDSTQPALPSALQPIPVHTVAGDDALLNPQLAPDKVKALRALTVRSSPGWKREEEELRPRLAGWSQATGRELTDLEQLIHLGDTLLIRRLYRIPPPRGLAEEEVSTIIAAGRRVFVANFKPADVGRLVACGLIQEVARRLEEAGAGKSPLKYALFSGHDTSLAAAMSALDAPLTAAPPYASRLNFSLFDAGGGDLRVETSFNDRRFALPACGEASCSLARFVELASLRCGP